MKIPCIINRLTLAGDNISYSKAYAFQLNENIYYLKTKEEINFFLMYYSNINNNKIICKTQDAKRENIKKLYTLFENATEKIIEKHKFFESGMTLFWKKNNVCELFKENEIPLSLIDISKVKKMML